jgi:gluconate 2-dehydrogenase gamma chain
MKRRYFLASATAACACSPGPRPGLRVFSEPEARALNAWLDCLIPADQHPGAVDAAVLHFIDRQLTRRYRRHQPEYREALRLAHRAALQHGAESFPALPFEQRTRVLEDIEQSHPRLFNLILDHCMQGFYGSPRHGGNKDYASWRMLGVPPAPVRGRLHYIATGDQA